MNYWLNRRQLPVDAELLREMREYCKKALEMMPSPSIIEKVQNLLRSIEVRVSMVFMNLFQGVWLI